jgi:hypothetical protein
MTTTTPPHDEFEALLRDRLHRLADTAPTTVRSITDIPITRTGADRPHGTRRLAGIGASIAALVGVAGITTVTLSGTGESGAATPEEAVLQFADALADEDVLGMIEVADPAEVPALRQAFEDAVGEAQRLDLLGGSFSLDGVSGVDVTIDGLVLATEELAPDVAVVRATGGLIGATFDPAAFAFGDGLAGAANEATSATTDLAGPDTEVLLATVRRDGRWFVSVSYTVAEYARRDAGVTFPTGTPIAPEGFDSPTDAATAFYTRVLATDFAGAVATAAPGEGDALARYASLWLPAAIEWATGEVAAGLDVRLTSVDYDVSGSGDRRRVEATSFVLAGTVPAGWRSDTGLPPRDPTLPTLIATADGTQYAIVPAGEPVPETLDGLELTSFDVPYTEPSNYTWERADGRIEPLPEAPAVAPTAPMPVRIERADGCTTYAGEVFATFGLDPATTEQLDETTWRSCAGQALDATHVFALSAVSPDRLPAIDTVRVDGRWYVSPIATIADGVLDVLRSVPDAESILDSRLAWYVYGYERASLESFLRGRNVASLSAACAAIVTDDGTTVTGIAASPTVAEVRACVSASQIGGAWSEFPPPGDGPVTVVTVPVSVAETTG